jgi:hypothetical protein
MQQIYSIQFCKQYTRISLAKITIKLLFKNYDSFRGILCGIEEWIMLQLRNKGNTKNDRS